jgi:response regulator RpfG family c-di-GMP phosphodiesterase
VNDKNLPLPGKTDTLGNPLGKKGYEVPLFGRIVAIADVYDALCSKRAYKEAWDDDRVNETMRKGAGTQFDPELIDIFFERLELIHAIRKRYKEEAD